MITAKVFMVNYMELRVKLIDAEHPNFKQLYKLLIEYNGIQTIDTDLITHEFFEDSKCILAVIKNKFNWLFI